MKLRKRTKIVGVTAVVALLASSAVAYAVLTGASGGTIFQVRSIQQDAASLTNSVAFVGVPGATISPVVVPSGVSRLFIARFSGESACYATATTTGSHYCSVRIVAINNGTGAVWPLLPNAGKDFAFDSTDQQTESLASWEAHAMERVRRLGPGSYRIVVQQATSSPSIQLRLDDWTLIAELAA